MGATSVTGVGQGAARTQKGPGNGRNFFVPQVNPHVVAAGTATMSGGTVVVTFPVPLAEASDKYMVVLTPEATLANQAYATKHDTSSQFDYFTITASGGGSEDVMWAVVKAGFGLDVARAD